MIDRVATLDAVLDEHAAAIGLDFEGYRNHVYRVVNLCQALSPAGAPLEKIAIAAAFHDMGIWTHGTFDYLEPSIQLANAHLVRSGNTPWTAEIAAMILEHHKITPYRRDPHSLVEPFRRADWVDVSQGLITFGVARAFVRELFSVWPSAGFHTRLIQLSFRRWRSHPLSPLPMVRR